MGLRAARLGEAGGNSSSHRIAYNDIDEGMVLGLVDAPALTECGGCMQLIFLAFGIDSFE